MVKSMFFNLCVAALLVFSLRSDAFGQDNSNGPEQRKWEKERNPTNGNEILKARKIKSKKRSLRSFPHQFQWARIEKDILYSYNYDADDVNFEEKPIPVDNLETNNWVVLTNFHSNMPLNVTNVFDRAKRTLSWATPYVYSKKVFGNLGSHHSYLALPKSWSGNKYRKQVSFILIPPGTPMSFKIGYAKEQKAHPFDEREGMGLQMRLLSIPKGSIVLTTNLLQKQQIRISKEEKAVNIPLAFQNALQHFLSENPESPIPQEIGETRENYVSPESFIEKNFQ